MRLQQVNYNLSQEPQTPAAPLPAQISSRLWTEDDINFWTEAISDLKPKKGRMITTVEFKMILCRLFKELLHTKGNVTECARAVSRDIQVSVNTVLRLYSMNTSNQNLEFDFNKRGKGSDTYCYKDSTVDDATLKILGQFILYRAQDGLTTNGNEAKQYLEKECNVVMSRNAVLELLKRGLHMVWGPIKKVSRAMVNPLYKEEHRQKQKTYLLQYSHAMMREEAGDAVIVYHDESYINTRHTNNCSWFCDDIETAMSLVGSVNGNRVGTGAGQGDRLIMVHAVTKHGLLRFGTNHIVDNQSGSSTMEKHPTAELIFKEKNGKANYHDNMDSATWRLSVVNKFFGSGPDQLGIPPESLQKEVIPLVTG